MKNIMVQHVPDMDNASTIFDEQINRILKSNFLLEDNELHICINGSYIPFLNTIEKIAHFNNVKFVLVHDNFLWCEIPTINYIKYICDNSVDDFYIGYIHLKGCSRLNDKPCTDWRRMMEFFIIDKYKKCIKFLEHDYDAVGCNWAKGTFPNFHPTCHYRDWETDRKSTRLNSSHLKLSRMPSSA